MANVPFPKVLGDPTKPWLFNTVSSDSQHANDGPTPSDNKMDVDDKAPEKDVDEKSPA